MLLAKGANPNVKDQKGQTALHQVVLEMSQSCATEDKNGYMDCLNVLLKENQYPFSVDINSQDNDGNTALHLATRHGNNDYITMSTPILKHQLHISRTGKCHIEVMFKGCRSLDQEQSRMDGAA